MKKVFVFLLLLLVISTLVVATEEVNLLTNDGFENYVNGEPEKWKAYDGWGGQYVSISNERRHSGSNAVKIVNTTSSLAPYTSQRISIEKCAKYHLSFWAYGEDIKAANAVRVKYEFYRMGETGDLEYIDENVLDFFDITDSLGAWVQFEGDVVCPEDSSEVNICLRLGDKGTVYFDDVSFEKIENASIFTLKTDSIFYYSDVERGKATAELNALANTLQNYKVDFALMNGSSIAQSATNCSFAGGKAEFTYELKGLSEKKAYTVSAIVKDSNGNTLDSGIVTIYKYPRPAMLTKSGEYMVDGKRFDPTFAYHVPESYYPYCKEAGINVVQGQAKSLDKAHEYGLKVIVVLYTNMLPAAHEKNIENTINTVTQVKDHPAVFAYAVMDEPFSQASDPMEQLELAYKTIRDIDDKHPVYCVDPDEDYYEERAKVVDILAINPYPRGRFSPATYVTEQTRKAKAASVFGRPVYVLLQAFPYGGYLPNNAELRSMWYQAVMNGAQGVGYYELTGQSISLPTSDLWEGICDFADHELTDSFSIVYEDMEAYEDEKVLVKYKAYDGYVYAVIQNKSTEAQTVTATIPGIEEGFKIIDGIVGDNRCTSIHTNGVTFAMVGGGVVICKLKHVEGLFFSKDYANVEDATGEIRVVCNSEKFTGGTLVIAFYENGVLQAFECRTIDGRIEIPVNTEYDIKAFVFSGGGITPLHKAVFMQRT